MSNTRLGVTGPRGSPGIGQEERRTVVHGTGAVPTTGMAATNRGHDDERVRP